MASGLEVLGAVQTVVALSSRIYTFFSSVKDAPGEVRQMCAQLQLLQKLFPEVGRSSSDLVNASRLSLDIIFVCLKGCESEFNTVWLAVEPLRSDRGLVWKEVLKKAASSVRWILKTEEVEKLTRNLERAKQTLGLAMLLAGMKVDAAVLEELASIGAKVDEYGRQLESHVQDLHSKLSFQLEQFEYRFLQKVDILSGATAETRSQSNVRITELYDSINPGGISRADSTPAAQPGCNGVNFPASTPETTDTGNLVESTIDLQIGSTASQTKPEIGLDMSILAASRNARQEWDTFLQGRPNPVGTTTTSDSVDYLSLINDGMQLILEAAQKSSTYEALAEALTEMQEAFDTCSREYELYPEPTVKDKIKVLYTDSLGGMTTILKILHGKQVIGRQVYQAQRLKDAIEKIKLSSQKVIREVEYLHRKELRQAHLRLREIDRKQDQVIRALEEQRKIMSFLQEENKALSLISGHQKVLQMLQQLLANFPQQGPVEAPPAES